MTGDAGGVVVAMLTAMDGGNLHIASKICAGLDRTEMIAVIAFAIGTLSTFVEDGSLDLEQVGLRAARMATGTPS